MNRRALRRLAPLAAWLVCAGLVPTRAGTSPARHDVLPLVLEPETRWSFGPFAFESEPEVEGGTVFVAGRDPTGRRALVVLDAERGRVQSRTLFPSPVPLVFSASGERVAVRTAAGRVDVFRVRGTRFVTERALTEPWISAPRLEDEELLACALFRRRRVVQVDKLV